MEYLIGVDIGGTNVKFVIIKDGEVFNKFSILTNKVSTSVTILDEVASEIINFLDINSISYSDVSAIGIGVPGPVIEDKVLFCVNLGWGEVDVVLEINKRLPFLTTVACLNDANSALYAEVYKKYNTAVMLTLGTGIGGSVFINSIIEGDTGSTGEFGHIHLNNPYNFKCNCGKYNCFETLASATGITKIYKYKYGETLECKDVFNNAYNGDQRALCVIEEVSSYIGYVCSLIALSINPEVILIGGGVSLSGNLFLELINQQFKRYAFKSVSNTKIIRTSLNNDSGGIGVALYAKSKK